MFRTDTPLRYRPWMNWALIALNVLVLIAQQSRFEPTQQLMAKFQFNSGSPRLLSFVTYAFIHLNWAHLVFNMVVLWVLGHSLNDRLGAVGYLAFYLAGAISSAVGFLLAGGHSMVGASGAVGAVMGAYLVLFPRSHLSLFVVVATLEVPAMYFITVFFAYNVIMSVATAGGTQQVAYEAHIAGMLFGFLVALLFVHARLMPRHPFDLPSLFGRWRRRRQYQQLVAAGYDPFAVAEPEPKPQQSMPVIVRVDPAADRVVELRHKVADALSQRNLPYAAALFVELTSLDPAQYLSRQAQLDVANQLASENRHREAADAYEAFFRHYPKYEQIEEVQLMAGLIYARHLGRYARARECLTDALKRLHGESKTTLARSELARVETLLRPKS